MLVSQQLALVPLVELEQLARDKQREFQSLYTPITFEGVSIQMGRSFNTPDLKVKQSRAVCAWSGHNPYAVPQPASGSVTLAAAYDGNLSAD
jgi:hypothetical protein